MQQVYLLVNWPRFGPALASVLETSSRCWKIGGFSCSSFTFCSAPPAAASTASPASVTVAAGSVGNSLLRTLGSSSPRFAAQ
eukprot:7377294-Prymnesium_polylepis.1